MHTDENGARLISVTWLYVTIGAILGAVGLNDRNWPLVALGAAMIAASRVFAERPGKSEEWAARCEECSYLEPAPSMWQALAIARDHEEATGHTTSA